MFDFFKKEPPKGERTPEAPKAQMPEKKTAPAVEKPREHDGISVEINGKRIDVPLDLRGGEEIYKADNALAEGGQKINDSDAPVVKLPYEKMPPELQLFHVAARTETIYPRPGDALTYPTSYDLGFERKYMGKPREEKVYVKVGEHVRLKQRVELDDKGIVAIVDVQHDAAGFPAESVRKDAEGNIQESVRNEFSPDGKLLKQVRTKIDAQGREIAATDTFTYEETDKGYRVTKASLEMTPQPDGTMKPVQREPESSIYNKETGYVGGNGKVNHLYA